MNLGRFRFLGTGSSQGVPIPGCDCTVCGKNQRLRTSGLFEIGDKQILLDVGPDFRQQALSVNLKKIDGIILTHAHYDHVAGLDELRTYFFRQGRPIPCLLSEATLKEVERRFDYLFERGPFEIQTLEEGGSFLELPFAFLTYWQGKMPVNGYRLGDFAFVSDIKSYDEAIFEKLGGLRHLVVSALRQGESHIHFTLEDAIAFAERVEAEKTWFVHMGHDLDQEQTNAHLPKDMMLSYDGLILDFTY